MCAAALAGCSGEVSAERRAEAVALAEAIVAPVGFERVGNITVEDPSFGILGAEPGSIIHEWRSNDDASTNDVLLAFDPVLIERGYERVAIACTPDSLTGFYWHELTGSAVLDRSTDQGAVLVRLATSWDEELPTDDITSVELTECSP